MEEENLIEMEGWLTLNSNGAVSFHDEEPYVMKTTVDRLGKTTLAQHEERHSWYCDGNSHYFGFITAFPGLDITSEKPVRVKLQIVSSC